MSDQEYFDEATNKEFMEADREAWYAICTILLTIIAIGLGLAFLAVYLVTLFN